MFEPENAEKTLLLFPDGIQEQSDKLDDKFLPNPSKENETEPVGASIKQVESPKWELRDRSTLKPLMRIVEANLSEIDAPWNYSEAIQLAEKVH